MTQWYCLFAFQKQKLFKYIVKDSAAVTQLELPVDKFDIWTYASGEQKRRAVTNIFHFHKDTEGVWRGVCRFNDHLRCERCDKVVPAMVAFRYLTRFTRENGV